MAASGIETRIVKMNDVNKDGGYTGLPDDQFVQLIAENGVFLYKDTPFYTATVELKKLTDPSIGKLSNLLRWKVPPLSLDLLCRVEDFFTQVYEKHKAEAVVLLYVSLEKKAWAAKVPEQTVSGASAEYDMKKMPQCYNEDGAKYSLFGSIHSHGSMGAFHSGTDDKDEMGFDGLHITIGDIPKPEHSYAVRFMVHGTSFGPLKLRQVVDFPEMPEAKCEEAWLAQVSERKYGVVSQAGIVTYGPNSHQGDWQREWQKDFREGKPQPVGDLTTGTKPATSLLDDRRTPPAGDKSKKKGKLRWQPRASFDHCYTCLSYSEGQKCTERGKTLPFASCSRYDANPDVPERHTEEAQGWAMLMEPEKNAQIGNEIRKQTLDTLREVETPGPLVREHSRISLADTQKLEPVQTKAEPPGSPLGPSNTEGTWDGISY